MTFMRCSDDLFVCTILSLYTRVYTLALVFVIFLLMAVPVIYALDFRLAVRLRRPNAEWLRVLIYGLALDLAIIHAERRPGYS